MTQAMELREELETLAASAGFARFGVARAGRLDPEGEYLAEWLGAGMHGDMSWMERTREVRSDVRHEGMLPGAASVIVLVTPYAREGGPVGPRPGRIARYARGRDYHTVLRKRLKRLVNRLRQRGHAARASVDSLPVFERAWAERSGVGFVGKNCCVIVPGLGSHVFLSTVVTSAELPADEPMKPRCGECRLCLDSCPTEAFVAPKRLDSRRCISYQTIENKGSIPPELRTGMGEWLFGCDACQDCCPFNRGQLPDPEATAPFEAKARWDQLDLTDVLQFDDARFEAATEASPLRRAGRANLARNAAIVLGNRGDKRHLPVLRRVADSDPSSHAREAAVWALDRIES